MRWHAAVVVVSVACDSAADRTFVEWPPLEDSSVGTLLIVAESNGTVVETHVSAGGGSDRVDWALPDGVVTLWALAYSASPGALGLELGPLPRAPELSKVISLGELPRVAAWAVDSDGTKIGPWHEEVALSPALQALSLPAPPGLCDRVRVRPLTPPADLDLQSIQLLPDGRLLGVTRREDVSELGYFSPSLEYTPLAVAGQLPPIRHLAFDGIRTVFGISWGFSFQLGLDGEDLDVTPLTEAPEPEFVSASGGRAYAAPGLLEWVAGSTIATRFPGGPYANVKDVLYFGPTQLFALFADGSIRRHDGAVWQVELPTESNAELGSRPVRLAERGGVLVSRNDHTVFVRDRHPELPGGTWTRLPQPFSQTVRLGLPMPLPNDRLVVTGDLGLIGLWEGEDFCNLSAPTSRFLDKPPILLADDRTLILYSGFQRSLGNLSPVAFEITLPE